ncbi:hypothetical protein DYQ86_24240 [Acidobacteria bacterium AB60]|nr:hypothetical protein DYQ86_24240 [Acidobacteria bacterium AB60]
MKHLTDEQLIEHYFGEGANRVMVETHLRICSRCEQVLEDITSALEVRGPEPPARDAQYGDRLWQSIQAPLTPYPGDPRRARFSWRISWPRTPWPSLVLAGACLLALAAAFFSGSLWERLRPHPNQAANSAQAPAQVKERVVLVILGDHLDRSERLLVQLNHAGAATPQSVDALRAEARQMLPDNRLYRQAISAQSDPTMTAALDHLERVLLEVANAPDQLDPDDIARIEHEMNTDSLLFQIRVLRARTTQAQTASASRKGSI